MDICPDAQLRLPSRVPHSHQRAAKMDRLLWKLTDPSDLTEREVTSPQCRGRRVRRAGRDHRMHRQRDSGDALEPRKRRVPVTPLDKALEVLARRHVPSPRWTGIFACRSEHQYVAVALFAAARDGRSMVEVLRWIDLREDNEVAKLHPAGR